MKKNGIHQLILQRMMGTLAHLLSDGVDTVPCPYCLGIIDSFDRDRFYLFCPGSAPHGSLQKFEEYFTALIEGKIKRIGNSERFEKSSCGEMQAILVGRFIIVCHSQAEQSWDEACSLIYGIHHIFQENHPEDEVMSYEALLEEATLWQQRNTDPVNKEITSLIGYLFRPLVKVRA